jgi:hypothetical protein
MTFLTGPIKLSPRHRLCQEFEQRKSRLKGVGARESATGMDWGAYVSGEKPRPPYGP